ncbi:1-deoxy-D-xylulose-5-phosphate synthase [Saccharothrix australiensis]|uniref:1-deoxy-D-xylulose-5-phosphate synthase n=1 Tax=Saccharothrix australiensis TaxID=2072 RepID=A0A495W170_9PSEU|nr:1-deoxy-D-xylulose-5-phosphate synthase [Saccharothrix australiensis]RKT54455.1 1-deoxy-D-xylulose-5-phosphate synthase [Saccharothrix australiensis]
MTATPVTPAGITRPTDVAALDADRLPGLAAQVRSLLIDRVAATGGHLGAGLGVVELTIALHRVFRSPQDVLVFDTGHQTYPHKALTGRALEFTTLRQAGGLSGYPNRGESPHDWVENSHASVSLAWADGIAKVLALRAETDRRVIAVLGDGALTGGVAWEGLNNLASAPDRPVIVVLNDNGRSYDPTVGGVAAHLRRLRRREAGAGNLFTALGLDYLGPVDGHDIDALCTAFRRAAGARRPVIVHAITRKGHGYPPAEADESDHMHACGIIDPLTGRPAKPPKPTWTDVFEEEIAAIAQVRADVVALTAGMRLPTGLGTLSRSRPGAVFDSGIAEQHLLASAAGLATGGTHPVVALYSTFLHRAFDQLLLDIALHRLPVTLVLDRAGITGPDGPSHHGMWDLTLLAAVPGMRVACPRDPERLCELLHEAVDVAGPTALRFPKEPATEDIPALTRMSGMDVLHRTDRRPLDVLLVAIGATAPACLRAATLLAEQGVGVTVVDPRWAWPPPDPLLRSIARHRVTVTAEDGVAAGGIGSRLAQAAAHHRVHVVGLPTSFLAHGTREQVLTRAGLTGTAIAATARAELSRLTAGAPSGSGR